MWRAESSASATSMLRPRRPTRTSRSRWRRQARPPADVVKTNVYIVNYNSSMRPGLTAARNAVFAGVGPPASTLIGVQALAISALMIEVEAIAVID